MRMFTAAGLVGITVMAGTCLAFYLNVGRDVGWSNQAADWPLFGDYFGGTAGTLMAFLGAMLVIYTIIQQRESLEHLRAEALKADSLRAVAQADQEISALLRKEVKINGGATFPFEDVVYEHTVVRVLDQSAKKAVSRLLQLVLTYSVAIAMYEANNSSDHFWRSHCARAEDLINFLERRKNEIDQLAIISLGFAKKHIRGESSDDDE